MHIARATRRRRRRGRAARNTTLRRTWRSRGLARRDGHRARCASGIAYGLITPQPRPLNRACPVCEARRGRPVWEEGGNTYVRCRCCATVFSDIDAATYARGRHNAWDEPVASAEIEGFYGDARRLPHERFLAWQPPTGSRRLLDVGCGLGYFAERARASGWNVTGCEPSAAWSAAARRRLGSGVVIEGVLDDVPANHRFDLITAWDVLEHIFDPIHFLGQIAVLLAPGGRLFIRTPNARYVLAVYRARRRLGHNVELGPLNHVVLFDAHSLRRALARAGLRPCSWRVLPPPQVDTFATGARRHRGSGPVVRAKNTWARTADELATRSRGRLVLGSDLDVLARLT